MASALIFSRDRPPQLDLLLRSMGDFLSVCETTVIHTVSTPDFTKGYLKCIEEHRGVQWWAQSQSFSNLVTHWLVTNPGPVMLLVDDACFRIEPNDSHMRVCEGILVDETVIGVSLRLCGRINYCYSKNRKAPRPSLIDHGSHLTWAWRGASPDWDYPMSLDGTVFRSEELQRILKGVEFAHPNALEQYLAEHPPDRPQMACLHDSLVFGIPMTRVQGVVDNRYAGIDHVALNREYLDGKRLNLKPIRGYLNRSVHQEVPFVWQA